MFARRFLSLVAISAALLFFTVNLAAQTSSLSGTIMDPAGAVVPNVKVTATNLGRNVTFETSTDPRGHYVLPDLPIGPYAVQAEAAGFKVFRQTGVELTLDEPALVNITLTVGEKTESVEVNAQASRVDTDTATLAQLVDTQRVGDLPLNGRNVYQLATLVPGTGTTGFHVNGGRSDGRETTANVSLDGALNVEQELSTVLPSPSPDAVQEFTIQTSVPSAQYAYASGVINVATKSGTNQLHGTAYNFFRNNAMDARNFFGTAVTLRHRNQYGVSAGGPVFLPKIYDGRNHVFWFFNWEQQKEPLGTLATIVVPTPAQLGGTFSTTIKDPTTGAPFPNNQIPTARLDPIALNVMNEFVPSGAGIGGTYRYQYRNDQNPLQVLAREDVVVGRNQFSWRDYWNRITTPTAFGSVPYFDNGSAYTSSGVHTFTFTRTLNSTTVNVLKFSWNNYHTITDEGHNTFSQSDLGKMGWSPAYYDPTGYFPAMTVSNYFAVASNRAITAFGSNTFTGDDDISMRRGKNSLDVGMHVMKTYQRDNFAALRTMGSYTYNGAFSGNALADFMLGLPSDFTQQNTQQGRVQALTFAWYAQDTYKASSRLSLNIGIRYELPLPPWEANYQVIHYTPGSTAKSTVFVKAPPGMLFYGDPGQSKSGTSTQKDLFGPRVGFSYGLTSDQKTVVRAGYGIFYNPTWTNVEGQYDNKQPWVDTIDVPAPPSTTNPWATYPGGTPFPGVSGNHNFLFQNASSFSYAPGFKSPNMQQWNVNFQRELAKDYMLTVAYVGSKGTHLLIRTDANAALYVAGNSTLANLNSRRPYYSPLTSVDWVETSGNSAYESGQISLDKRLSKHFSVLTSYTFSKSIDCWSDSLGGFATYPTDPNDFALERAPSLWNATHVFNTSFVWELPSLKNSFTVLRHVFGNWELNGIWSVYSGPPLAMTESVDYAVYGLNDRPNRLCNPIISGSRSKAAMIAEYFNTSCYSANGPGQFGTAPRTESQIDAPGTNNLDMGLFKHMRFRERYRLDFRAELFNMPNHPTLGAPNTTFNSPLFGQITTAGNGRIIQLALKLLF